MTKILSLVVLVLPIVVASSIACSSARNGGAPTVDASADGGTDAPPGDAAAHSCSSYNAEKNLYFGDLHIHTDFSGDAYNLGTRLGPSEAYAFAKGSEVAIYGGRKQKLARALDFGALTDHAEWLSPAAGSTGSRDAGAGARTNAWQLIRDAARAANDATAACTFTSFVAYEWTGISAGMWMHRNVIFRSDVVPELPVSSQDQTTPQGLWSSLTAKCLGAGTGCDVLAIPHNTNMGHGLTFRLETLPTADDARARAKMEPLVEIHQSKGSSECKRGLGTDDPLCDLEIVGKPVCDGTNAANCVAACTDETPSTRCDAPLAYVRNALKKGLEVDQKVGQNPFKLGFIGSTDTHNATPGSTEEDDFKGHAGMGDADPRDRLGADYQYGGGGLAAVWAEENSRDAIFSALRRREVYGTSGTRIKVRAFGAWSFPSDACQRADLVTLGYAQGVPMGGDLAAASTGGSPQMLVWALRDQGAGADHPGTPLQRIQIVKGWIDVASGTSRERVYEVVGRTDGSATVDASTCSQSGPGSDELCAVWTDPDFVAEQRAFYYARVIENPSCRHTAYDCRTFGAATRPTTCTDGSIALVVQERAWTSPIWYSPNPR